MTRVPILVLVSYVLSLSLVLLLPQRFLFVLSSLVFPLFTKHNTPKINSKSILNLWVEGHCLDMPLDMLLLNFRPYVPTGAVSHDDDDDGILFICISIVDLESCDNSLLRLYLK